MTDTEKKIPAKSEIMLDDILNSIPDIAENEKSTDISDTETNTEFHGSENIIPSDDIYDDIKKDDETETYNEMTDDIEPASSGYDYEDDEDEGTDYGNKQINRRKRRRKRMKKHGGGLIFGLILTMFIITVAVFLAVTIISYSKEFMGLDKSDIPVTVEIPEGAGAADIAEILYGEEIISEIGLFRIFSRIRGADGSYYAGEHVLMPKMSYGDIIDELTTPVEEARDSALVVFPEGITLLDAAMRLEEKGICTASEFIRVFNSENFGFDFEASVIRHPLKFYKMEGYLFPDTYEFYLDEDPRVVAKKICRNFEAKITPDIYGRMNDLGMELEEVLTLASIIQAEAAYKSDMRMVASVFLNRLENPDEYPLLQSDPTTKYVNEVIIPNLEINSEEMFEAYDTYKGAGLTPGPVCNPGIEAINAVLYPAETDYYYFCSNIDTGEFFFAETLGEHENNLVTAGLVPINN